MKIVIGNDHAAVDLKKEIMDYVVSLGHEVVNYGTDSIERTLRKILCTKHESWRHEEEERMVIRMKSVTNGTKRSWGTYQLDHIVIGNKINDAFKSIILAIARKMNVPVFMIDVSRHDFQLDKILLQ